MSDYNQAKFTAAKYNFLFNGYPLVGKKSSGELCLNPLLKEITPYWLSFDTRAGGSNRLSMSTQSEDQTTMSNDFGGDIEINHLMGDQDSIDYTFKIKDHQIGQAMMNRRIHAGTIIGTYQEPFQLPFPILLESNQVLEFDVKNLGAANTTDGIVQVYQGTRYYFPVHEMHYDQLGDNVHQRLRTYFYTTENNVSLTADSTETAIVVMNNDEFLWKRLSFYSDGEFKVSINRANSSRQLNNVEINSNALAGNRLKYWDFRVPVALSAKERIEFKFTDLSSSTNNIYVTLTGARLYK